ncbi:MAG: amine dehydrogenase large subunit [Myxococcota bacterium]
MPTAHAPRASLPALGAALAIGLLVAPLAARADARAPRSLVAPALGAHHVWVTDTLFGHAQVFDGDTGEAVATIDTGMTLSPKPPHHARSRSELYSVEIAYARFRRGERTDYVTIHDDRTYEVKGEVVLPTRTSESATSLGYSALLDDERFLATFNQLPVASVSITDMEARAFVGAIPIAGCAGIYPLGARRFASLCADGTLLEVALDDAGRVQRRASTPRFFDAVEDPVMMAGGRAGARWVFVTFAGVVHEVDFAGDAPALASWSLLDDADRAQGWRPGGKQNVALHAASGRLYAIVHRGGTGSHKEAGPEVWAFDLASHARVARIAMPNFAAAFLATTLQVERGGVVGWLLDALLPGGGAHSIAVTQDDAPLLFARNEQLGAVAVLDARTGDFVRWIDEVGITGNRLEVER